MFLWTCVSGLTCAAAFIITLLFAQDSGFYWVTLFDNFAGSVPLLATGLFEMIAVVYVYGIDRLVLIQTTNTLSIRVCFVIHLQNNRTALAASYCASYLATLNGDGQPN